MAGDWTFMYGPGFDVDPLDWSIQLATTVLEVAAQVSAGRRADPGSFQVYIGDPDDHQQIALKIIGSLLEAGWTMPTAPKHRPDP